MNDILISGQDADQIAKLAATLGVFTPAELARVSRIPLSRVVSFLKQSSLFELVDPPGHNPNRPLRSTWALKLTAVDANSHKQIGEIRQAASEIARERHISAEEIQLPALLTRLQTAVDKIGNPNADRRTSEDVKGLQSLISAFVADSLRSQRKIYAQIGAEWQAIAAIERSLSAHLASTDSDDSSWGSAREMNRTLMQECIDWGLAWTPKPGPQAYVATLLVGFDRANASSCALAVVQRLAVPSSEDISNIFYSAATLRAVRNAIQPSVFKATREQVLTYLLKTLPLPHCPYEIPAALMLSLELDAPELILSLANQLTRSIDMGQLSDEAIQICFAAFGRLGSVGAREMKWQIAARISFALLDRYRGLGGSHMLLLGSLACRYLDQRKLILDLPELLYSSNGGNLTVREHINVPASARSFAVTIHKALKPSYVASCMDELAESQLGQRMLLEYSHPSVGALRVFDGRTDGKVYFRISGELISGQPNRGAPDATEIGSSQVAERFFRSLITTHAWTSSGNLTRTDSPRITRQRPWSRTFGSTGSSLMN